MQNTSKPSSHREYFYTIDLRGNLIHDGAIVDDPRFLHRFFTALSVNDTTVHADYPFVAKAGSEWSYVACADTPIVFTHLHEGRLCYAADLDVEFDTRNLRFGDNGVLYHSAPVGAYGRLAPALAVELSGNIQPWGPWFAYHDTTGAYDSVEVIEPLAIPTGLTLIRPRAGNQCIGCGREGENGLKLSFLFDSEKNEVHSWFRPDNRLMGSLNIMHGGFVALLLDETMGKVLGALGIKAPTAQLNVRFRAPVPIAEELELYSRLESMEGRKNHIHGEVRLSSKPDKVLAEASALFIRVPSHNVDKAINVSIVE